MVDSSDSVREFFRNEILEAIPAIHKKNKRPDSKAIFSFIERNSATNVDESFIDKMLNELLAEKVIVNGPTSCGDLFFIVGKKNILWKDAIKSIDIIKWNLYKADTIRSKKKCPLYGDVRFIECFPKTQLFSKI